MENIAPNCPLYLYQIPMFMVTVSTVLIVENGVVLINNISSHFSKKEDGFVYNDCDVKDNYRFPHGIVKAGQETVQFNPIRTVKEQIGINISQENLMPVDFRSNPDRSEAGNEIDIGFVCSLIHPLNNNMLIKNVTWNEINLEEKKLINNNRKFYMDHEMLLQRAIDVVLLMRS